MSNRTAEEQAQFGRLRAAYEEAFRQLSSRVRFLQSLTSHSVADSTAVRDARRRVEEARAAYRESRHKPARGDSSG